MRQRVRSGSAWRFGQLSAVFLAVALAFTLGAASRGHALGVVLVVLVLAAALHPLWRWLAFVEIDDDGLRVPRLGRRRFRWDEIASLECAASALPRRNWRANYLVKMHLVSGAVITLPAPRAASWSDAEYRAAVTLLCSHLADDPGQPPERPPHLPVPPPAG